jgi:hypothetical protein
MTSDGNKLGDMSGVAALADVIPGMGALTSLNLADNNLGALVLPKGWEEYDGFFYGPDDEDQDNPPPGSSPTGIIAIANAISDMRALSSLNVSENQILSKESGKALADALAGNTILTELDLSHNQDEYESLNGAGFAQELAVGIKDNGVLTSLNISNNFLTRGAHEGNGFHATDTTGMHSLTTN